MHTHRQKVEKEISKGSQASIIDLVHIIIDDAEDNNASDVHIEPMEMSISVRFRIDGMLEHVYSLPKNISKEIVSRIKIMSGLRTDIHQMPQDGRSRIQLSNGRFIDIRISVIPTYHGENAVLRLLVQNEKKTTLSDLGFSVKDEKRIIESVGKSSGMILATGPTGSGKTTTLYTLLDLINKEEISIVTIEDPIEYSVKGIKQIQVNTRTGLTFSNGLRSILRQDPNVIMVGEIRDTETAGIAVNSALTGHLVLSTLHTNDAASTLARLCDMSVEPYLLISVISDVIAQRLVRKICENCKVAYVPKVYPFGMRSSFKELYKGTGCDACDQTGYLGRVGIYEVLPMSDEVRGILIKKPLAGEIKKVACKLGMKTLKEDGFEKARSGITSIEEVLRVIHE